MLTLQFCVAGAGDGLLLKSNCRYAFTNGACVDWQCKEELGGKGCEAWFHWNDRVLYVPNKASFEVEPVYFGHCSLFRAPMVEVTFYVELGKGVYNTVAGKNAVSIHDVADGGVYLAGGGLFGVPGDNLMVEAPDIGENVFQFTHKLEQGSSARFAFVLGDDSVNWQGKENLEGHTCSFGEWNDREVSVGANDMSVGPFCFGRCCSCAHIHTGMVDVDFSVDMSETTVSDAGVFLAGGAYFGPMLDEYKMSDSDGDGIYTITVAMPSETHQHYIFANGKCADTGWDCKEDLVRFSVQFGPLFC
jgi:hypothetical protein